MRKIQMVHELKSPARDLPEGVTLTAGKDLSTSVADDLVRDGFAVYVDEQPITQTDQPEAPPRVQSEPTGDGKSKRSRK